MFERENFEKKNVFQSYRFLIELYTTWTGKLLTISRDKILIAKISRRQSQTRLSFQSPPTRFKNRNSNAQKKQTKKQLTHEKKNENVTRSIWHALCKLQSLNSCNWT